MANISQVKLPNNTSYDIVSRQTRGLFRGNIDSTSTSTAFTATVPGITELYDGLMVVLKNSVVATKANITLNINNLGAKPLFTSTRNAVVTTHWAKDTQWLLYYDATNSRWVMYQGVYTSNTNTIGEYGGGILAGPNSIFKYALALKITQDRWESVVLSSSTATSKTKNPNGFLTTSPILYVNNGTYTEGNMVPQGTAWTTSYNIDSRYSTNGTSSWSIAGKSFYLVGTINDTTNKFFLANTWWANQLPSTEDGLYYWYVGQFYDAYRYSLHPYHPIFYYKNGEIKQYFPNTFEKSKYEVGTLEAGIRPLVDKARANRLAFLPADQIIIEATTDGGTTWVDAGVSDENKRDLFGVGGVGIQIPHLNDVKSTQCGLRITITGMKFNVPANTPETEKYNYWNTDYVIQKQRYFNVREWYFWVNSNNDAITPQIYAAERSTPNQWETVFNEDFRMRGYSGPDWIRAGDGRTFGAGDNDQSPRYWNWRLIFWSRPVEGSTTFKNTTRFHNISNIRCYGDSVWVRCNNLSYDDRLYSYDNSQNAFFPAEVTATKFNGTATNATTVNNHTVESNVPPNLGGTIVVSENQPTNQNVGDIWLEVNNLFVGRNLLLDSEKETVSPAYTNATVYTPYYYVSDYGKPFVSEAETLLTVSCEFEVTGNESDKAYFYCQLNSFGITNMKNYGTSGSEYIPSNSYSGIFKRSFALSSNQAPKPDKRVRFGLVNATAGTVLKIRKIKLELGNRASGWIPAPEDNS